jgi:hypothetical protein
MIRKMPCQLERTANDEFGKLSMDVRETCETINFSLVD